MTRWKSARRLDSDYENEMHVVNGWKKIKLRAVGWLCFDAPKHLRWRWVNHVERNGVRLQLVSPRGIVWDFKLNGGAWIRRTDRKPDEECSKCKGSGQIMRMFWTENFIWDACTSCAGTGKSKTHGASRSSG